MSTIVRAIAVLNLNFKIMDAIMQSPFSDTNINIIPYQAFSANYRMIMKKTMKKCSVLEVGGKPQIREKPRNQVGLKT